MRLVDSHCHLDAIEFDGDRDAVLERAHQSGVTHQVVPATHFEEWPRLRDVCADHDDLHPVYGLHPTFLRNHEKAHLQPLQDWIERERPVAIGECGLDYYIDDLDRDAQQFYFDGQLKLARDNDLPVVVHARRAVDAVLSSIRRIGGLRGVVHSFSGSEQQARQLWELDFMVGLGGPVTYERAQRLRRLATNMPIEYLLLETDAPDQPDAWSRGMRNEPASVKTVCEVIAGLRGETAESVAAATSENAIRLFGLPVHPLQQADKTR